MFLVLLILVVALAVVGLLIVLSALKLIGNVFAFGIAALWDKTPPKTDWTDGQV